MIFITVKNQEEDSGCGKQEFNHGELLMKKTCLLAAVCACISFISFKASAVSVTVTIDSGSVGVAYAGLPYSNYSASGFIYGDLTATTFEVTGGTIYLTGTGPDSVMTITSGLFSQDGSGFFYDYGQGPFDVGVPVENPGYVLNGTGFGGTLGDTFGNILVNSGFGAEGFGLADAASADHSMTSFFWNGATEEGLPSAVPVPAAAWLFGSGLLGMLGVARRKKPA